MQTDSDCTISGKGVGGNIALCVFQVNDEIHLANFVMFKEQIHCVTLTNHTQNKLNGLRCYY